MKSFYIIYLLVYQLDTQLTDAVMFAEPLELDKTPLDSKKKAHTIVSKI